MPELPWSLFDEPTPGETEEINLDSEKTCLLKKIDGKKIEKLPGNGNQAKDG